MQQLHLSIQQNWEAPLSCADPSVPRCSLLQISWAPIPIAYPNVDLAHYLLSHQRYQAFVHPRLRQIRGRDHVFD